RRTRAEMPASPEEVEAALEEGIRIDFLTGHVRVARKGDRLALTLNRMMLGEPDASGRRRPVPVKGSEFTEEFDTIIGAIGQVPEIPAGFGVKTARGNIIEVDPVSLETGRKGVWAGGDAVTGPDSVIRAIAAGRIAASSIDKYLGGSGVIDEELSWEREIGACAGITDPDFPKQLRARMPCLPPSEVKDNFREVELGFPVELAIAESKRCFQCGFRAQIPPAPAPPSGRSQSRQFNRSG
ncbi:MAG: FAD-dependent oxidoreductase, partial [Dehalococcoidales bacterium]|nr:FAD-dependent oxidoreductase [Dehalococcoidales bacterium]